MTDIRHQLGRDEHADKGWHLAPCRPGWQPTPRGGALLDGRGRTYSVACYGRMAYRERNERHFELEASEDRLRYACYYGEVQVAGRRARALQLCSVVPNMPPRHSPEAAVAPLEPA